MKRNFKKIIKKPLLLLVEYLHFIFGSAAENQLRLQRGHGLRGKIGKFTSYSHLKRCQKRSRKIFLLAALFIAGMLASRIFLPVVNRTEVYIPEGEGEILTSNVGGGAIAVVFKTLDAANFNKPLATTATVSVYGDAGLTQLVKVTDPDDYAVTHLINVGGLDNGRDYYLKISASDSAESGDRQSAGEVKYEPGKERFLKIHTGALASRNDSCEEKLARELARRNPLSAEEILQEAIESGVNIPGQLIGDDVISAESALLEARKNEPAISNILHESALYEKDKVQTIISWRTNLPATTAVKYREGRAGEEKEISIGSKIDSVHMAVFTNFKPGTVYYFQAKSVTEGGQTALSEEFSLLTPKRDENMLEMIGNNFKQLFKQLYPRK